MRAGLDVTVLEIKDKSLRFTHELRNDETGEIAATTTVTAVHIDTTARRARPFAPDIRARAEALIARGDAETGA